MSPPLKRWGGSGPGEGSEPPAGVQEDEIARLVLAAGGEVRGEFVVPILAAAFGGAGAGQGIGQEDEVGGTPPVTVAVRAGHEYEAILGGVVARLGIRRPGRARASATICWTAARTLRTLAGPWYTGYGENSSRRRAAPDGHPAAPGP